MNLVRRIYASRYYAVSLLVGMMALSIALPPAGYAAVPKLDQIRVALIMDSPQYRSPASAATLSAAGGLQLGLREASSDTVWLTVPKRDTVRLSADQFMIRLAETANFQQALSQYQKINLPSKSYLFSSKNKGTTVYRVEIGPFAAKAEAAAALQPLDQSLKAGASITGNFRWAAGSYPTEEEARLTVEQWSAAGFAADVAVTRIEGKVRYAAWIGSAADDKEWSEIKNRASEQMPGTSLTSIDPAVPYLIKREDLSFNLTAGGGIAHYHFHPGEVKWIVSPIDSMVKVQDRKSVV